jgi:hypothetical protein
MWTSELEGHKCNLFKAGTHQVVTKFMRLPKNKKDDYVGVRLE